MAVTNKTYAELVERVACLEYGLELLKDIYEHIEGGGALYEGSMIFAEDNSAIAVLGTFLRSTGTINARP